MDKTRSDIRRQGNRIESIEVLVKCLFSGSNIVLYCSSILIMRKLRPINTHNMWVLMKFQLAKAIVVFTDVDFAGKCPSIDLNLDSELVFKQVKSSQLITN